MTLDEAIEYYIKAATQRAIADEEIGVNDNSKWNETKFMTKKESEQIIADNQQLAEWLKELRNLREENINLKNDNERLRDCVDNCVHNGELDYAELAEAKRLLKAAVEGMRWLNENTQDSDGSCAIRTEHGCSGCPLDINGDLFCKWKHEDEALALIGEDGDTND